MNFVFIFIFIFKRAFDALFSSDRNRQTIYERFRFIFIFNRRNDINFIFYFDFLSFRLFRNFDRNVNCFFEKFIFDFGTLCLKNIEQFFIFDFSEIESSFCYFCFFLELNQKILKSLHFRVCDVCAMMCDMINYNNHAVNATLLFDFFAHASDTTNVLC